MRSTSKSVTFPEALTDQDGNKHDAVFIGSIVTRQGGYDCRYTLQYPYESQEGTVADAVIRRGSVSCATFIPFNASADLTINYVNFCAVAQALDDISPDLTGMTLEANDIFGLMQTDFESMISNLIAAPQNVQTVVDPDTSYITTARPAGAAEE